MASDAARSALRYLSRGGPLDLTPLHALTEAELDELKAALNGSAVSPDIRSAIDDLIAARRARRTAGQSPDPEPRSLPDVGVSAWLLGLVAAAAALAALLVWLQA